MIDTDLLAFVMALNTAANERVHLESPPQTEPLPLIVLRRAGGDNPTTTQGRRLWVRSSIEINVQSKTHAESYPIMKAVMDALHGFKGTIGTTEVADCRCVSFPDHITEIDGDNRRRWITAQFRFLHTEG